MAVDPLLIFDRDYYRQVNPDLAGLDDVQAYLHFNSLGLDEGRKFSRYIDLDDYGLIYPPFKSGGKTLFSLIVNKLINDGWGLISPYLGNIVFYWQDNPDLHHLNGEQVFEHLMNFGIAEGRRVSEHIDITYYKSVNPDLSHLSNEEALEHLVNFGIDEGRSFSRHTSIAYYKSVNPDLAELSNKETLRHLVFFGMPEGRKFAPRIDIPYYKSVYRDLDHLNNTQALRHLLTYGIEEGRILAPPRSELANNSDASGENTPIQAVTEKENLEKEELPLAEPKANLSGKKLLQGNEAGDLLVGEARDEILSGETGKDILIGAGGSDIFVIDTLLDNPHFEQADFIVDFDKAMGDRLGLRGNISAADLTFAPIQIKTEDLGELGRVIEVLDTTGLSFEELSERLSSGENLGLLEAFLLQSMDRESLETLFSSGVTPISIDPNGDGLIEATAIAIDGGFYPLAFAFNTDPADLSDNIISLL